MLLYFHELGLEALAHTEAAIKSGRLDTNFLYYWGMLSACHGYVMCAALANGNDLLGERAGRAAAAATNLDAQRLWFSHVFSKLQKPKEKRELTDFQVVQLIPKIIRAEDFPDEKFDKSWYEKMLANKGNEHFELTSGFQQRGLSVAEMKRLIDASEFAIPDTKTFTTLRCGEYLSF